MHNIQFNKLVHLLITLSLHSYYCTTGPEGQRSQTLHLNLKYLPAVHLNPAIRVYGLPIL